MSVAERQRIWRIRTEQHLSKYGHPNGWRIVRCDRDWDLRTSPKRWWEVYRAYQHPIHTEAIFATLREAREWCDEHVARSDEDSA